MTSESLLMTPESLVGVQCFGQFGASGRARTVKIGRHVRDLHKFDLIKLFSPDSTIWVAEGREKIRKN